MTTSSNEKSGGRASQLRTPPPPRRKRLKTAAGLAAGVSVQPGGAPVPPIEPAGIADAGAAGESHLASAPAVPASPDPELVRALSVVRASADASAADLESPVPAERDNDRALGLVADRPATEQGPRVGDQPSFRAEPASSTWQPGTSQEHHAEANTSIDPAPSLPAPSVPEAAAASGDLDEEAVDEHAARRAPKAKPKTPARRSMVAGTPAGLGEGLVPTAAASTVGAVKLSEDRYVPATGRARVDPADPNRRCSTTLLMPVELRERVRESASITKRTYSQIVLAAIEFSYPRIAELVVEHRRDIGSLGALRQGGLFPEAISTGPVQQAPTVMLPIRVLDAHLVTIDRIVVETQAESRSQMCRVALEHYFSQAPEAFAAPSA